MRNWLSTSTVAVQLAWVMSMAATSFLAAGDATPAPPSGPATISVFVTNDIAGKDPFFPQRQLFKTAEPRKGTAPQTTWTGSLQLKGIIGPPDKRYALINNTPFAAGEQSELRVDDDRRILVKCVEIREGLVVVEITSGGSKEKRELKIAR